MRFLLTHKSVTEFGNFDPHLILSQLDISKYEKDLSIGDTVQFGLKSFGSITIFVSNKGYIEKNTSWGSLYRLTELGREVKRKGGHKKYIEFLNQKDNAIFENIKYASQAAQAAKESVQIAKNNTRFTRTTMWWIGAYTIITLILTITTIVMCNQNKRSMANHIKTTNSTKDTVANKITDMVK